jgi:hypothetical protein
LEVVYGLLFSSDEEQLLKENKDIIRIVTNPTIYTNNSNVFLDNYSILCDDSLDNITSIKEISDGKFVDTEEYNILFEAIIRLMTDSTFITNSTYENFYVSSVDDKLDNHGSISFIWNIPSSYSNVCRII